MYKYMKMRPAMPEKPKKSSEEANTGLDDDSVEDVDLEKFADEEMEREMKRMA